MSTETSYKNKIQNVSLWMDEIIQDVKKDLRNEHLKQDYAFVKKYLAGKNIHKLELNELSEAYAKAISEAENGEAIAEFIANRWIFRNSEIYNYFEQKLRSIRPDFTEISSFSDQEADALFKDAAREFGALKVYLFSLFNAVAFSDEQFKRYFAQAKTEVVKSAEEKEQFLEKLSQEELKSRHAQEIARISDRYEKKLLGMQKKYTQDVELLKKQLANLQRKLAAI